MTTRQLEFTADELLADETIEEPLIVDGVRCHGGFDSEGKYVSPRTKYRWPAIHAWEEQREAQFGSPILDIPLETWPENFPNVEQSKFLIRQGAPEPTISALTRIGTVEGFGVLLRSLGTPDFSRCFEEDVVGTAIEHIDRGLFEAHARDEAGFADAAGHDRMWFVARDLAFDHPSTTDMKARMLRRMGIDTSPRSASQVTQARQAAQKERLLPDDIDFVLETVVARMVGLLLIEISAFHGFAWAEGVLGDTDLVAGDELPPRSSRSSGPTRHLMLRGCAPPSLRCVTGHGWEQGRTYPGTEMIGCIWDRAVADSLGVRRQDNLRFVLDEIEHALAGRPDGRDVMQEMLSLGSVVPEEEGSTATKDLPSSPH